MRHPDVTAMRNALIRECKDKEMLDPRETDVRGSYHVNPTLSVDEIRAFLVATAESSDECFPDPRPEPDEANWI